MVVGSAGEKDLAGIEFVEGAANRPDVNGSVERQTEN